MNDLSPMQKVESPIAIDAPNRIALQERIAAFAAYAEHSIPPTSVQRLLGTIATPGQVPFNFKAHIGSRFLTMDFMTTDTHDSVSDIDIALYGDHPLRNMRLHTSDNEKFKITPYESNNVTSTCEVIDAIILIDRLVKGGGSFDTFAHPSNKFSLGQLAYGLSDRLRPRAKRQATTTTYATADPKIQLVNDSLFYSSISQAALKIHRGNNNIFYEIELTAPTDISGDTIWTQFSHKFGRPATKTVRDQSVFRLGSRAIPPEELKQYLANRKQFDGISLGRRTLEMLETLIPV